MVWLESPMSQLFKTFFGLKIHWILSPYAPLTRPLRAPTRPLRAPSNHWFRFEVFRRRLVASRMGEWMGKSVRGWTGWLIRLLRIRGGWVTGSMGGQVGVCLLVWSCVSGCIYVYVCQYAGMCVYVCCRSMFVCVCVNVQVCVYES